MATNDDNEKIETVETVDEAALNEEASRELAAMVAEAESTSVIETDGESGDEELLHAPQSQAERSAVVEALIFVSEEPLSAKVIADVLKEDRELIEETLNGLATEFNSRNGG